MKKIIVPLILVMFLNFGSSQSSNDSVPPPAAIAPVIKPKIDTFKALKEEVAKGDSINDKLRKLVDSKKEEKPQIKYQQVPVHIPVIKYIHDTLRIYEPATECPKPDTVWMEPVVKHSQLYRLLHKKKNNEKMVN